MQWYANVTSLLKNIPVTGLASWCIGQPWGGEAIIACACTVGAEGVDEDAPILPCKFQPIKGKFIVILVFSYTDAVCKKWWLKYS